MASEFVSIPPAGFDIAGTLVTECASEDAARELAGAAMAPYRQ